eukprot:11778930-Ditylum_brightwellii.AAC.1
MVSRAVQDGSWTMTMVHHYGHHIFSLKKLPALYPAICGLHCPSPFPSCYWCTSHPHLSTKQQQNFHRTNSKPVTASNNSTGTTFSPPSRKTPA